MNSLPCWPPSLLLLWGLEDMFNILLYSSSSPLIQPQPQVPAALWLLMARDERRGTENPLIMTSTPLLLHCCRCYLVCSFCTSDGMCSLSAVSPFSSFSSCSVKQHIQCSTKYLSRALSQLTFKYFFRRNVVNVVLLIVRNFCHFQDPLLLIVMCSFSYI